MVENSRETKKICIAHVVYSFAAIGGLENGLINILNHLDPAKYFHIVCSLTGLGKIRQRVTASNVKYFAFEKQEGNDITLPFKLYPIFKKEKVDVVHLRNWATMVEGFVAGRLARIPFIIYSEHGRHFEDVWQRKRVSAAIHRFILNHVDVPLCVSDSVAAEMKELYELTREVKVIINGVDTEKFQPMSKSAARRQLNFNYSSPVIGTVGRLDKGKNFDQLIVDFLERCEIGRLIIVGDGPERVNLQSIITACNADDRVILTGHLDDIPAVLNNFDLFVLPSASEGLSNVLLEAMSCGLPVVAYDVGGNSELIAAGQGGFLIPAGERDNFISQVADLLCQPRLLKKMASYNREMALACYSLKNMVHAYDEIYSRKKVNS